MFRILTFVLFLISSVSYGEDLFSLPTVDGTSAKETEREETLSYLEIQYGGPLLKSYASRGMFATHVACQLAKARNATHFVVLEKSPDGKEKDKLVVGITNNASDTVASKWKKFEGKFPVQDTFAYEGACKGLEKFYK